MVEQRRAIIIGAGGAIGGALADALDRRGNYVCRLSRTTNPPVDLLDPATIERAAAALAGEAPFDLLLIATGGLHGDGLEAEKTIRALDAGRMEQAFRLNAIGPMLAARAFLPLLDRSAPVVIGMLSARVGSISDNRLGGWYSYRSSKAALNQLVRTLAIELARTHATWTVAALHPGTVDSPLSAPFQRNLPTGQLKTPAESAAALLDVIGRLSPADSGWCFDWRGERIPP